MEYLESEQNYQKKFEEGLFKLLLDMTKDFPFSKLEGDSQTEARTESHESQLKRLISSVRLTAMRTYRQMPVEVRRHAGMTTSGALRILFLKVHGYRMKGAE